VGYPLDHSVQVAPRPHLYGDSAFPGEAQETGDASGLLPARQPDSPEHPSTCPQGLQDRVWTRQDLSPLGRDGRTRAGCHALTSVTAMAGSRRVSGNSETAWVAIRVSSSRKPCVVSARRMSSAVAQAFALRAASRWAKSS
jgi:hypothetical protein